MIINKAHIKYSDNFGVVYDENNNIFYDKDNPYVPSVNKPTQLSYKVDSSFCNGLWFDANNVGFALYNQICH